MQWLFLNGLCIWFLNEFHPVWTSFKWAQHFQDCWPITLWKVAFVLLGLAAWSNGTHLLKSYPLIRLLLLLSDERTLKPNGKASRCKVSMRFRQPSSRTLGNAEWIHFQWEKRRGSWPLRYFFSPPITKTKMEMLADWMSFLSLRSTQSRTKSSRKKYPDWLLSAHPNDDNLLVYVNPKLGENSEETVGDKRWHCLDFQLLNDKLLNPLLEHPSLNDKTKPFIIQYVKKSQNTTERNQNGYHRRRKKEWLSLYTKKYSDVFDSIYDALKSAGAIEHSTSEAGVARGRASWRMAVKIAGKVFDGNMVMEIYEKFWNLLLIRIT